jgi:hypothetical protein
MIQRPRTSAIVTSTAYVFRGQWHLTLLVPNPHSTVLPGLAVGNASFEHQTLDTGCVRDTRNTWRQLSSYIEDVWSVFAMLEHMCESGKHSPAHPPHSVTVMCRTWQNSDALRLH